jgi:hypothetical protein
MRDTQLLVNREHSSHATLFLHTRFLLMGGLCHGKEFFVNGRVLWRSLSRPHLESKIPLRFTNRSCLRSHQTSATATAASWRRIQEEKLNRLIQKNDSKGVYNELINISSELIPSKDNTAAAITSPTISQLGSIATALCLHENRIIRHEFACDIFDIIHQENPQITQSGYEKLLDLCLYEQQSLPIPSILTRMKAQNLSLSLSKYETLIKYLISQGKLLEAAELTSANHLTQSLLLTFVEPLFISGNFEQYFQLLNSYLLQNNEQKQEKKELKILDSYEISNILISIIWAWGRCAPSPSCDANYVSARVTQLLNTLLESHSQNEKLVEDLNLAKIAFHEMFFPLQSFHSSPSVEGKAEVALAKLRWKFLSSSKYVTFPFLKQNFLTDEDVSLVMQINDLTLQLSNPEATVQSNRDYSHQQAPVTHTTMQRYSNVLLSKSFWPDVFLGELKCLIEAKDLEEDSDDDEYDTDDDEDDDEEDEENVETDASVHGGSDSELLTSDNELNATAAALAATPPPSSSQRKQTKPLPSSFSHSSSPFSSSVTTHHEDSSSDDSEVDDSSGENASDEDKNFIFVLSEDSDYDMDESSKESGNGSDLSRYIRYSPEKLRHLESMHTLGCHFSNTRAIPGLECLDLTDQLKRTHVLGSAGAIGGAPVLFSSSLFNEFMSHGAPFVGESILNASALEVMEQRFRMSG